MQVTQKSVTRGPLPIPRIFNQLRGLGFHRGINYFQVIFFSHDVISLVEASLRRAQFLNGLNH